MSKAESAEQPRIKRAPEEQVEYYAALYRDQTHPASLARLTARAQQLQLQFTQNELLVFAALNSPARVQDFLNTQVYYNNDHAYTEQEETALSPHGVLRTGAAHCFEGALFAYAVNFLHAHDPKMILLEASEDSDHNVVLYQDPETKLYGGIAHSRYPNLDGRMAQYVSVRALVESYLPYYYSDYSLDPNDLTLVGYSEPFDLVARYGMAWMDSQDELWDIYSTYIDDTIRFHDLDDYSAATHIYPMLRALKHNWIRLDGQGKPYVSTADLPRDARALWDAFWGAYDEKMIVARGEARFIAKKFFGLARLSPLDLMEYAREFEKYLARGYRVEQILKSGD